MCAAALSLHFCPQVLGSRGYSSLQCTGFTHCSGFSCCRAWALGHAGSIVVEHGLTYSLVCGVFPDQGSNPCSRHWQVEVWRLLLSGAIQLPMLNSHLQPRPPSQTSHSCVYRPMVQLHPDASHISWFQAALALLFQTCSSHSPPQLNQEKPSTHSLRPKSWSHP